MNRTACLFLFCNTNDSLEPFNIVLYLQLQIFCMYLQMWAHHPNISRVLNITVICYNLKEKISIIIIDEGEAPV